MILTAIRTWFPFLVYKVQVSQMSMVPGAFFTSMIVYSVRSDVNRIQTISMSMADSSRKTVNYIKPIRDFFYFSFFVYCLNAYIFI